MGSHLIRQLITESCICLIFINVGFSQTFKDPQQNWDFALKDFVIAAWAPPKVTDAEYALYQAAGFNVIMSYRYIFPKESLDLAQKYGLHVMIDTYATNDKPWGGTADPYTPHPSHHPATLSELKWLHERIGNHPALAGYLLGDDQGILPPELIETTNYLRKNVPYLFPWICQCTPEYENLLKNGNPLANPQIYPTLYHKTMPVTSQVHEYCEALERLCRNCRKYHLINWPMFNICGPASSQFDTYGVVSDSLLRFQPYAALAYGAQGVWYFTFTCLYNQKENPPKQTPGLTVVGEVNHRIAAWGKALMGNQVVGIFHTGFPTPPSLPLGEKKFVKSMSDDLLLGLLVSKDKRVYAMVVDKRMDSNTTQLPPRTVKLEFTSSVKEISIVPAPGNLAETIRGNRISLALPTGGGQLLLLDGPGILSLAMKCEQEIAVARVRKARIGPEGLLLHLTFDEGQGNLAHDTSGAENHVSLAGGAKWTLGKIGKALDLRGLTDSAIIGDAVLPAKEAMTVACWVNPTYPIEGYGPIIVIGSGGNDRFEFGVGPDNLYPVLSNQESHSDGRLYLDKMKQLIPEGTWGHLVIAAGPKGATVYVNGEARRYSDYKGIFDFKVKMINIGCRFTEDFTGLIDELRIYNRCLSAEEVKGLFVSIKATIDKPS